MATETLSNKPTIGDFLVLCKIKVVAVIMLTAIVAMFLATPGLPPLSLVILGSLGIFLASCSAAVFNHIVDQKVDNEMHRTANRPLPEGKISSKTAFIFGLVLGVIGIGVLLVLACDSSEYCYRRGSWCCTTNIRMGSYH